MSLTAVLKRLFKGAGQGDFRHSGVNAGDDDREFRAGVVAQDGDRAGRFESINSGERVDVKGAVSGQRSANPAYHKAIAAGAFVLTADAQASGANNDFGHVCTPLVVEPGAFADWLEREATAPDGWLRKMVILTPNVRLVATLQPTAADRGQKGVRT